MKRLTMITMLTTLSFAACAKQAPGTHPADMTAAEHRSECVEHKEAAAAATHQADDASKSEYPKAKYPAQDEAKKENDIADQHEKAAQTADQTAVAQGGTPSPSTHPCL